jgi:uncharacterized protein (TIGR02118 family)
MDRNDAGRGFISSRNISGSVETPPRRSSWCRSDPLRRTNRQDKTMARMITIFTKPNDVTAFERHYFESHVPLAKKLPGLRKYEVSTGPIATRGGVSDFHLVSMLHFDSLETMKEAFASPQGQACAKDRRALAPDEDAFMLLFDTRDI